MAEIFVNFTAQTTLAAALTAGATSLEIVATGASPAGPQFRIRIDNELMLVTAVAGTTYTVTRGIEGTTAAAHTLGAIVRYVVTAAALGGQSDPIAATPGLRSLGTGAQQAAPGNVLSAGNLFLAANGSAAAPSFSFASDTDTGFYRLASGAIALSSNGGTILTNNGDAELRLRNSLALSWSSGDPSAAGGDVFLVREAANVLALRNAANAQTLYAYNTFTDASNYERAELTWSSNQLILQSTKAGSGSARPLFFGIASVGYWNIELGNANFSPQADNARDLGGTSTRIRTGYFGTRVAVGDATNAFGHLYVGDDAGGSLYVDTAASGFASSTSHHILRRARGTQASRQDVANGDWLGYIQTHGWSGGYHAAGSIRFIVDGVVTSGQAPPSRIEFHTNVANAAEAVRLTISNEGALVIPELGADASAPAANHAALFVKDNGSGKSQFACRFASGAVQILATEP